MQTWLKSSNNFLESKVIIISIVKAVIDNWDPINLLSHAPSDEYHSEIEEIEKLLDSTKDHVKLATEIYNIFLKSFGSVSFLKTQAECTQIAKKIISG